MLTKLGVHSRLEAASFSVHHRLPDLWPQEAAADSVPAQRLSGRTASLAARTPAPLAYSGRPGRGLRAGRGRLGA